MEEIDMKYLRLLTKQYPTIAKTATEIINLEAIMNLPKGTEHFLSDVHGEYSAFEQVLRNGSGVVKRKIRDIFGTELDDAEINSLSTLVYYPEEKMDLIAEELEDMDGWYRTTLLRLIEFCQYVASKYTRSKVRKAMPADFAYILEELLQENYNDDDKRMYYEEIIQHIISLDRAEEFISALSRLIQQLVVDHLHIVGDVYDRGPYPDKIMDTLMNYHSLDFQWGNHDILWMGAASGSKVCAANVIRISARYLNLDILEDSYGISLRPLALFADAIYQDDPCTYFQPKNEENLEYSNAEITQIARMHKAMAIIQFKLEGEIIVRHDEFHMKHRLLLDFIDYQKGTIRLKGQDYDLLDTHFPTIDPENPYQLTPAEQALIEKITASFKNCHRLQKHVQFLYAKGSMFLTYNGNLLYHGCIPLHEDGTFMAMELRKKSYAGRQLLEQFEILTREAYVRPAGTVEKKYASDIVWYLWTGAISSLFGKSEMTTFERYFIADKATHTEEKNPYYKLRNEEAICQQILEEFGLDANCGHIINGHTPVKEGKGESPIKADGKMLVIDGGFAKAYHKKTKLAGYTLLFNSYGLQLVSHQPFTTKEDAVKNETDILSTRQVIEMEINRKRVKDTDIGKQLHTQAEDLKKLLNAYQNGLLHENH
ncbi:Fructose-1,6-bisphosphatase class 3 [Listeria ivanovii subsp. londoniensis]|uniref:Fructose-1,6-bisphosphatase class 3 n=2 Tax=Listeria ivanovii TaxID=1638 RepID=A0ABS1G3S9_LISIV|nr:fructose-bisphosphatase class III [Listeria ivanovii]AIS59255.1 fructose 1,6-bisphosphatase [Listeria ivanovii subsp. londoniensis]MBK1961530.1 fructose-bisphosphatase class III [Listeria ivanovii subsp. londoniensis]MBK2002280.1 fructose-bisphosphatase class III [Listeria ivanovii subsp. londoniensis]SDW38479.1 fructose-1,6-bisphosphatase-3 [Listeria ivanovii]VEH45258.1 Fructose-1,6-bisphosphatase class 3 [Listeria ivanovii subsp. londoniensis]